MTREDLDFIGSMNMCDEISNEAYKKIVCHFEGQEPMVFKLSVRMDIEKAEKCHQKIKEQIKEGVVLLPYYIDLISPQEQKTEQEIREELNRLSTYRVPNSNTDLVSRKAVERVLNLVFRGCRNKEPKTDILDKIRAEIEALNNIDYVEPITVDEILQIIDKYNEHPLGYNPWQE